MIERKIKKTMKNLKRHLELSNELKKNLGLRYSPIAVKLVNNEEDFELDTNLSFDKKYRYCQMLMETKHGKNCVISGDNLTCPAAAAAFGFKSLPEKIAKGSMLKSLGLFEKEEYGKNLMEKIPRLKAGEIEKIIASPLEKCDFIPDLIIIEDIPERIMWLALASLRFANGRHSFSTGIFQAVCVDSTIIPYQTQKVNVSLGCYGCRDATDIKDDECIIGIPYEKLDSIVSSVDFLTKKAMSTVRNKKALKLYKNRE
jgi:uncharacterized protein (DUF169 family)